MLRREDLRKTECYNDFLRPQQIESAIGATVVRDDSINFMTSIIRGKVDEVQSRSSLEYLQALMPHLRRVCEFYRNDNGFGQEFASARGAEDALRTGAVRIGPGGWVRACNAAARRFFQQGDGIGIDLGGRLRCSASDVLDHIGALLSSWPQTPRALGAQSFSIPRKEGAPPLRLTVLPPRIAAHEAFFRGPECVVLVEIPQIKSAPAVEEMAALYGLTAAEKRILVGPGHGRSLVEIAGAARVSLGTVRIQLKQIFAKTGAHRQVDLMRMLYSYAHSAVDLQGTAV